LLPKMALNIILPTARVLKELKRSIRFILIVNQKPSRLATPKPKIVIEVNYEEIQKSPTYSSGFALRFPRFVRLRTEEKSAEDASDINFVEDLYYGQKKSK